MGTKNILNKNISGEPSGEPDHSGQRTSGLRSLGRADQLKPVALFVTFTAACMAGVAAWERGGSLVDKVLLVSMSTVIVLAVHLIPALSRRWTAWPVWMGCLLCAMYGHLTFLIHASQHANDDRAQHTALTSGTERQMEVTRMALARINARPVATVASELAVTRERRERAALRMEIAEGRRAEALEDELVKLSGVSTIAQVTGATDPVTSRIAKVTGCGEGTVTVVIGMTFSILIELVGALLWYEALRQPVGGEGQSRDYATANVTEAVTGPLETSTEPVMAAAPVLEEANPPTGGVTVLTNVITDPVASVMHAVQIGQCRPTVAGIRVFLGCSQARASELRREIAGLGAV